MFQINAVRKICIPAEGTHAYYYKAFNRLVPCEKIASGTGMFSK